MSTPVKKVRSAVQTKTPTVHENDLWIELKISDYNGKMEIQDWGDTAPDSNTDGIWVKLSLRVPDSMFNPEKRAVFIDLTDEPTTPLDPTVVIAELKDMETSLR